MASLTEKVKFYESAFGRGILSHDEKNFAVKCPICDPRDPSKKKLIIRTADDVTHCWVCGFSSRTLVPLLRKYVGKQSLQTYIEKFSPAERDRQEEVEQQVRHVNVPEDARIASLDHDDPDCLAVYRYLTSRGVTERDMWLRRIVCSRQQPWYRRAAFVSHDAKEK